MPRPQLRIANPKRGNESRVGRAGWYPYYAGYSTAFVADALALAELGPHSRVLDPWNGSGTTTDVAAHSGHYALGFDLNPTMVIVAKARLLDATVRPSLNPILHDLLAKARGLQPLSPVEPLEAWFRAGTAHIIRNIERAIQLLLISPSDYQPLFQLEGLGRVSALAAFFYVGLFRVLQKLLSPFRSANPTWVKQPDKTTDRLTLREDQLFTLFRGQITEMAADLSLLGPFASTNCEATIDRAMSACLPVEDHSIDLVVTSPPYCTRIDYVKKTGPELALLGATNTAARGLRDQMIGTPTIHNDLPSPSQTWGSTCLGTLDCIFHHDSYASRSYYWKTYLQYFDGLHKSLQEVNRTLRPSGKCVLVVQDSHYKDLHVNLAVVATEMAQNLGWVRTGGAEFTSSKTIVGLNTHAIDNGNPKTITESVLAFRAAQ
jgi:DNA modification methylase